MLTVGYRNQRGTDMEMFGEKQITLYEESMMCLNIKE